MPDDRQLLRDYARDRSESAFAELARRHVDLVYSAALRETHGDAPQAQDITQAVFTELARKAALLGRHPALAGWLYTCVRQMSANARRTDERRRRREQEAHAMKELLADSPESAWQQVKLVLDDAMHELNDAERAAVVLRYFENRSHGEVGDALGLSETAARKRVDRALEKLRTLLARRGVTSTASGLTAALAFGVVMSAPSGLAAAVTTGALASALSTTATTTGILKLMAMSKLKLGIIGALLLAGAATTTTLVVQHHANSDPDYFPKESWHMAGYATPEDTVQTFVWAMSAADAKALEASMTPDSKLNYARELTNAHQTSEQYLKELAPEIKQVKGFRLADRRTNSADEVVLKIILVQNSGSTTNEDSLQRFGNEWKIAETPF